MSKLCDRKLCFYTLQSQCLVNVCGDVVLAVFNTDTASVSGDVAIAGSENMATLKVNMELRTNVSPAVKQQDLDQPVVLTVPS